MNADNYKKIDRILDVLYDLADAIEEGTIDLSHIKQEIEEIRTEHNNQYLTEKNIK